MKVREEDIQIKLPRDPTRSSGLHLSTIIRDLALKTGVLDSKWDFPIEEGDTTLAAVGMAWEDWLAKHTPELEFHPGELHLDGIAMSPDGIIAVELEDGRVEWVLVEIKSTLKSSRDFRELLKLGAKKVLQYLWQVKSYRYALNKLFAEHKSNLAQIWILFLRSDYNRNWDESPPMQFKIFHLEFSDEELEVNWGMITSHAEIEVEEDEGY